MNRRSFITRLASTIAVPLFIPDRALQTILRHRLPGYMPYSDGWLEFRDSSGLVIARLDGQRIVDFGDHLQLTLHPDRSITGGTIDHAMIHLAKGGEQHSVWYPVNEPLCCASRSLLPTGEQGFISAPDFPLQRGSILGFRGDVLSIRGWPS
jgi:hypothetical protein